MARVDTLYDQFVEEYGDELEEAYELLGELSIEYPDATNGEIVDYTVSCVIDANDTIGDVLSLVGEFKEVWGKK